MRLISVLLFLWPIFLFSSELNPDEWAYRETKNGRVYFKKDMGRIPTLCFHKIGDEERYAITPENFDRFLIYLNKNKFYLLSDKELINSDFSLVPTGYKPIVLGSDDASEGNFLYDTDEDFVNGAVLNLNSSPVVSENTMVSILEKNIKPVNGRINFTFYISFNGIPFRQTGGYDFDNELYKGNPLIKKKFNYILDNFIIGNHTFSHPITKNSSALDFKIELDTFYSVMESYIGERISEIDTLAFPYGCHDLKPEMEKMLKAYSYKETKIIGSFDFNGYFSNSPFSGTVNKYDISRIGVDNKNIEKMYYFLENIELFESKRVFKVNSIEGLESYNISENDIVEVLKWKLY